MKKLRSVALSVNDAAVFSVTMLVLAVAYVALACVAVAGFVADLVFGPAKPREWA